MTSATHDSLLSSTLTALLNAQQALLNNHESRLTALERQRETGTASSWKPWGDLKRLSRLLEVAGTVMRVLIWCGLHIAPWLSLIGTLLWQALKSVL
jgi:hypothetical protein